MLTNLVELMSTRIDVDEEPAAAAAQGSSEGNAEEMRLPVAGEEMKEVELFFPNSLVIVGIIFSTLIF
jgi:hypothetical protein